MSLPRFRRLAVLGALAVTVALSACGDGPTQTTVAADTSSSTAAETGTAASSATTTTTTASTTTSTGTTIPAGSTSPTSEPAGTTAGSDISMDAATVWADVFSVFTVSEQSCIRDAVDEELLESVLDRLVLESPPEEWVVSIFSCLAPETARALFLSLMIAGMEGDEELDMELTEEEISCLREWMAGVDVGAAVGALADEDPVVVGELTSGMFSCLEDLLFSMMLEEMGVEFGELGEDEASCVREWVAGADFGGLFAGDPDAAFAFLPALLECVPDLLDAPFGPDPGTSLTMALGEATAVAIDEEAQGELDEPGDFDWFVFEAIEGEVYQIDVALGTLPDSVVGLYDADETELAFNDDYEGWAASRIVWVAPSSGSYYVKVAAWGGGGTGSYILTVVAVDIVDDHAGGLVDATSVMVGGAALGVVDYPADADLFVFDAVGGELYQIDVALGTLADSLLVLYDADGWQLAYNDDHEGSPASRIVWKAPSSGSYYIEVFELGGGTGSYTLTVVVSDIVDDHADDLADATPVMVGGAALGVVDYTGDVDLFVFEAAEGELYQIDVALGTLDDSVVALFDSNETELAWNDDYESSQASRVFWEAPSSGSYYIQVFSWDSDTSYIWEDDTGSYTLTIVVADVVDDHASDFAEATPVRAGEAVPGVVNYLGDVDSFVFEATEGELYQIDVALGTLADSSAVLYDADGSQLAYNVDYEGSSASRIVWEAPSSGSYYIAVSSWWSGIGSYTLTIIAR